MQIGRFVDMWIGIIGLGRMGFNIMLHLREQKHAVVAYNRSKESVKRAARAGAVPAYSIDSFLSKPFFG